MWDWIKKNKKKVMFLGIPLAAGIGMSILVLAVPATLFAFAAIPFVGAALGSLLFGASSIILSALLAGAIIAAAAAIVTGIVLGSIELHHLLHPKTPANPALQALQVAPPEGQSNPAAAPVEQSNPAAEEQNQQNPADLHNHAAVNAANYQDDAEGKKEVHHQLALAPVHESLDEESQAQHSASQTVDAAPVKSRTPSPAVSITGVPGSFYSAPAAALAQHVQEQHDIQMHEAEASEAAAIGQDSHV